MAAADENPPRQSVSLSVRFMDTGNKTQGYIKFAENVQPGVVIILAHPLIFYGLPNNTPEVTDERLCHYFASISEPGAYIVPTGQLPAWPRPFKDPNAINHGVNLNHYIFLRVQNHDGQLAGAQVVFHRFISPFWLRVHCPFARLGINPCFALRSNKKKANIIHRSWLEQWTENLKLKIIHMVLTFLIASFLSYVNFSPLGIILYLKDYFSKRTTEESLYEHADH